MRCWSSPRRPRYGGAHRGHVETPADRAHVLANVALALLSAALTAALFLLVLLLVDGWRNSPAAAAVAVTAVRMAALAAGRVFRGVRAGARSQAVKGSVLITGDLRHAETPSSPPSSKPRSVRFSTACARSAHRRLVTPARRRAVSPPRADE
jgi:hypothetical protein